MELTLAQYERIEAYLTGQLTEADHRAFESELAANPALQNELATQRDLLAGYQVLGLRQALQAANERYRTAIPVATEPEPAGRVVPLGGASRWSVVRVWAVAASLLLVLGIGWWAYRVQQDVPSDIVALADRELSDGSLKAFPNAGASHRPGNGINNTRLAQQTDWYVVLSLLKQNEKKKAVRVLRRIANTPAHRYRAKADTLLKRLD